jgi:hypothetical protein
VVLEVLEVPLAVFRVADSKQKNTCPRPLQEKVERRVGERRVGEGSESRQSFSQQYIVKILMEKKVPPLKEWAVILFCHPFWPNIP